MHMLAYADPSNGISPSVINTDYVSLDVEVVAGSNKAYFTDWNVPNSKWGVQMDVTYASTHTFSGCRTT
jgi:hypothetical protein